MSDRFSIHPSCSVCGANLDNDEYGQTLMMPVGEFVDLACPKCGIVWRFLGGGLNSSEKNWPEESK